MMKKALLIAALLCALLLGAALHARLFAPDVGVVLLANRSSQTIASARVSVCGRTFAFSNLPSGEDAAFRFNVAGDSHYEVEVTLDSGRAMRNEFGYVTNGVDSFDRIEVTDAGVTLRNAQAQQ